tara:strand:- start:3774 stop:4310 length:537 start_codon:yes stop_codon:yes gene_type:complete
LKKDGGIMDNKYTKVIFEFREYNYKNIDFDNNYLSPISIFCSFYSELIFHLESTGIYFLIIHNYFNYNSDADPVQDDIQLLRYFIKSIRDINEEIKSEELDFFIDYLNHIYKIDINAFIHNTSIDKELSKISYFENMFMNKKMKIERDIAFFICEKYYNEDIRNIFPEFQTIKKLNKF